MFFAQQLFADREGLTRWYKGVSRAALLTEFERLGIQAFRFVKLLLLCGGEFGFGGREGRAEVCEAEREQELEN
jgi:hypothetical protein